MHLTFTYNIQCFTLIVPISSAMCAWMDAFLNSLAFMQIVNIVNEFSVPQIEYPLGGSSKKGSHIYFLLIVAMVLLLWCQIVLLWHQVTMVASEQHSYQTIILPRKLATGSIHDYLFCYCPLVGILFEVLRINWCTYVQWIMKPD